MIITSRLVGGLLLGGVLALSSCGDGGAASGSLPFSWPPVSGEAYPDLELQDFRGRPVKLSSLRGKVLLIEPIGMT